MIIPIDHKTRLKGTEDSWNIEVLHTPKVEKEPYWKPIKYYGTFSQALTSACQR